MACSFHDPSHTNPRMTYCANDFDTPFYQRPHDLPATTATDPPSLSPVSSTMNFVSLSSTALLPREVILFTMVCLHTMTS